MKDLIDEYTFFYYCLIVSLTAVIVVITHIKLGNINKTVKPEYLLKIDKRMKETETVKARAIIHELYLDAKDSAAYKELSDEQLKYDVLCNLIGNSIVGLAGNKEESEKYLTLLNYMDFMESIAYFEKKDDIALIDLYELLGQSLTFNYKIFRENIKRRRNHPNCHNIYGLFEDLAVKLATDYDKNKTKEMKKELKDI